MRVFCSIYRTEMSPISPIYIYIYIYVKYVIVNAVKQFMRVLCSIYRTEMSPEVARSRQNIYVIINAIIK